MSFQYPNLLLLLVALVPIAVLWRWSEALRRRKLANFAAPSTWGLLVPNVSRRKRFWKNLLLLLALAFAILAMARPLLGTRERQVRSSGLDILVAVDVSRSMLATDVEPDRLTQAKRSLRQLLASFPGQRIGVIPFAGDAFTRVPLTSDYGIALQILMDLTPRTIGTQGTDLGRAIEVAREAFKEGGAGSHVLILVTDGEDHEGQALEQAKAAAEEGVTIYPLGIGSADGAPIVVDGRFLEDAEGSKVLSRLGVETLREIAAVTGGNAYIAQPGTGIDVRPLIADLEQMQGAEFGESKRVVKEERYQWPLAAALLLLMAEGLIGERKRVRSAAPAAAPSQVPGGARA